MQNVCVGEKHARFFQYNNSDLLHEVNKVIDANENNLVIYIKNVMKKNLINKFAPFHAYEGTEDIDFAKVCAEICEAQNPKRNAARIARRRSIHPSYGYLV